jgi:hypothetical protein
MLPDSNQLKSFWSRPEGKTGIIILAILVGLGILESTAVLAFLVAMLVDITHIIGLCLLIFGMLWVVFSKTSHRMFRLISRYLTGLLIELDPIGIVEDKVLQMKKRRAQLGNQIKEVSGQLGVLKGVIDSNIKEADMSMRLAEEAKKRLATDDEAEVLRMKLQMRANANKAGRRQQSNIGYKELYDKIKKVYDFLKKWSIHIDFYIDDTDDQVKEAKIRRKTINSAYRAFLTAIRLIKGDADENDLYDRAMEFMAEDATRKLGEMEEFQDVAQNFMASIDLQNGVVETKALEQLDRYEQKLLTSGDQTTAFLLPGATETKVPVAVPIGKKKNEYFD